VRCATVARNALVTTDATTLRMTVDELADRKPTEALKAPLAPVALAPGLPGSPWLCEP
jgi:hypothetical protein